MREKKLLPTADGAEGLGRATIMDPTLAASHGVAYVHLAAFAIDIDRVREYVEGPEDPRPFGWEVFLAEAYLLRHFDPTRRPEQVLLFEDVVLSVLDGRSDALGSQIAFAIWDAIERERFPVRLRGAFATWKARPTELVEELAPLHETQETLVPELAEGCLATPLDPPLAKPTLAALREMAGA